MKEKDKDFDHAFWAFCVIGALAVFFSVAYSHHGLIDYRAFRKETTALQGRIHELEVQNAELRRRLDLVRRPTTGLREQQARDSFNWVADGDLIYFEEGTLAENQFTTPKVRASKKRALEAGPKKVTTPKTAAKKLDRARR